MKKVSYLLVAAVVILGLTTCGKRISSATHGSDAQLKEMVEMMKQICPFKMSEQLLMDEVEYVNNAVTMSYIFTDNTFDINAVRANEVTFRNNTLLSYANNSNGEFRKLIEAIIEAEAELIVVFKTKDDESFTMRFTAQELESNKPGENSDPEKLLIAFADNIRLQTPQVIADGMVMTNVTLDRKHLVYVYTCDEPLYDIDALRENAEELKSNIVESLVQQGVVIQQVTKLLKETKRTLAYKYIGSSSGKSYTVYIDANEL